MCRAETRSHLRGLGPSPPRAAQNANHDGGNARDLVESFAARHPCDRIQFNALRELAAAEPRIDAGLDRLARATASSNRLVATLSAQEIARIEAQRDWIEQRG